MNLVSKVNEKEKLHFNSMEELKQAITSYLESFKQKDEMILYAHQINDYRQEAGDSNPQLKLKSVIKSGLSAYHYGSVDGTLCKMGSSVDKTTIDKIINYDYHNFKKYKDEYPVVVLAFPKYIVVDGKTVEFCSSQYSKEKRGWNQKLDALLNKHSTHNKYISIDSQYTPKTWLDIIKGFGSFKNQDTLFAFCKDEDGYSLYLPHTHWWEQNEELYKFHKQKIAEKIKKYNSNLEAAIIEQSEKNQIIVDAYLNDID